MKNKLSFLSLSLVFIFLLVSTVTMHPFGYPGESGMDDYFIENAQRETASNNVVTSVVFDYRGLDTLGEATVLFTSVAGIALLFRKN